MNTTFLPRFLRTLLFFGALLCCLPVYAGNGTWSRRIELADVSLSGTFYTITEPSLVSMVQTHQKWRGRVVLDYDREGHSDLDVSSWGYTDWKVKVTYVIKTGAYTSSARSLTVSYDNGNYVYTDFDGFDIASPFTVQNSYQIQVQKVEGWKRTSPAAFPSSPNMNVFNEPLILHDLHLRMELDTERGYELLNTEAPQMSFVSTDNTLHWGYVEGAEWYDVEWVFLDAESEEYATVAGATNDFATAGITVTDAAKAFLEKEATRVRVWGNSYQLDMIFPEGQLFFRIRSVGLFSGSTYGGMTDQVKVSDWTYHENAVTSGTGTDYLTYAVTGFEEDMNWSYGIAFSEGGKSVSSVSYYDGTFRGRQSLTYNTSDNVTLIGEAKFDYEGRQTVSVLPAPVHGRDLLYHTGFNKAYNSTTPGSPLPFDETAFDRPDPLRLDWSAGADGGASQYFSPNNAFDEDLFQAAIPDAKGYAYSRTVYRNDGTGRIEKAAGVGEAFATNGSHTVRTFYATPTVTELKRLFGENVPDELNGYRKVVTRDPNGQYSVAFYDKRGNVIATGLTGGSPSSLKKLEELQALETAGGEEITTSLLGTNSLTQDGLSLIAETTVFNEIENNLYTFTYDIDDALQQVGDICFTCKYKLHIVILDPDLQPITLSTSQDSYTADIEMTEPTDCNPESNYDAFPVVSFTANFTEIGEYRIIKTLTVDNASLDEFLGPQIIGQIGTLEDYIEEATSNLDYSGCFDNCEELSAAMALYHYNQAPSIIGYPTWESLTTSQQEDLIEDERLIYCSIEGMEDPTPHEDPLGNMGYTNILCTAAEQMMLQQIGPNGVFYPDVAAIEDHREYCHLSYCDDIEASNTFDLGLMGYLSTALSSYMSSYDGSGDGDALTYLNLTTLFTDDPFTDEPHPANASTELENAVNGFAGTDLVDYVLNTVMPDVISSYSSPLSVEQENQISIHIFAGMYMWMKKVIFDHYKADNGCSFFADENTIFMGSDIDPANFLSPSALLATLETQMETVIQNNIGAWTSSDCHANAVSAVNGWMQTFSEECLQTLASESPALHTPPATPVLYTLDEIETNTVPTAQLEELLFDYALEHCGEQLIMQFYDDGSAAYDGIMTICTTYCTAPAFEVLPPEEVEFEIVNQTIGGCFEQILAIINDRMLPTAGQPLTEEVFEDEVPCHPDGGFMIYGTGYSELTIDFIDPGCKLEFRSSPVGTSVISYTVIQSITNPVKVVIGGVNYLRVTILKTDGTIVYGYLSAIHCIGFGDWDTYTVNPFDPGAIPTPTWWQLDCIEAVEEQAEIDATIKYNDIYNQWLAELSDAYVNCLDVEETFTANYLLKQYQYTLYYYDLAGNLVQTVPPQGVELLNATEIAANQNPQHRLTTRYSYNGLNTLTASFTPDGGRSVVFLDKLYRTRFSQDAQQAADGRASYMKYDALGRVYEAGEFKIPSGHVLADKTEEATYPTTGIMDYTHTYYEEGYTDGSITALFTGGQQNLRNAIGAVLHRQADYTAGVIDGGTEVLTVISYSYDPHKNVKELVSTNYQLEDLGHQHKKVAYTYDLLSGNVNEVVYQKGQNDAYYHRYQYDANNRLVRSFTSRNGELWEMDAKYFYYLHGPLARQELGHDKVQGLDFAYTMTGWLKGVNSATLVASRDMGKDAHTAGLNKWGGVDAFGFQLGYYENDYQRIGATVTLTNEPFANTDGLFSLNVNDNPASAAMGSLYNGNITHMVTALRDKVEAVLPILGNNYQYDQLQRIKQMKVYTASGLVANNNFTGAALYNGAGGESAYQENYSFDKNGNLLSLKRNGDNAANLAMDNFEYRYYTDRSNTTGTIVTNPTLTNRLANVGDAVTSDPYTGDIASGQADDNYRYNQAGQLIMDKQEYIDNITWTPSGKVKRIYFTTAGQAAGKVDHKFIYDPMDRRVAKIEYQTAAPYTYIKYTYYTYDAGGNVMATYERTVQKNKSNNNYTDKLYLAEHVVYGADRIGAENSDALLSTYVFRMTEGSSLEGVYSSDNEVLTNETYEYSYRRVSDKHYELANHLGNVLAVVTDRKIELGTSNIYTADVVSYSDYSPYGTMLYNRHGQTEDYRYGFQGQEADDNLKGEGNSYNYTYRMHDPRIGRFFAMDPLSPKYPWYTPYQFSGNKLIAFVELEGLEENSVIKYKKVGDNDSELESMYPLEGLIANVNRVDIYGENGYQSTKIKDLKGNLLIEYSNPDHINAKQINRILLSRDQKLAEQQAAIAILAQTAETKASINSILTDPTISLVENGKGLITGTDFSGQTVNRGEAGAMVALDLIPFLKPAKYISKGYQFISRGKNFFPKARLPFMSGTLGAPSTGIDFATTVNTERSIAAAKKGWYDVIVHGSPNGDDFFLNGQLVGPETLYKTMLENGYQNGTRIRLISCHSGALSDGAAQKLSTLTNAMVVAPTNKTLLDKNTFKWIVYDGKFVVFRP